MVFPMESKKMNRLKEKGETSVATEDSSSELEKERRIRELHIDIIIDILCRLPARSLIRFTLASKLWFCLVHHPHFIEQHLDRTKEKTKGYLIKRNNRVPDFYNPQELNPLCFYRQDEEPVRVFQPTEIGGGHFSFTDSCNGLICFVNFDEFDSVYIYNPATRDYLGLPKPYPVETKDIALAYDAKSKDYKVFRLSCSLNKNPFASLYEVYTLGSADGWRSKGLVPYYHNTSKHIEADGALHWLFGERIHLCAVLSIDISTERCSVHHLPETEDDEVYAPSLLELDGKLSLCLIGRHAVEHWILEDLQKSIWTRKYRIRTPRYISRSPLRTVACSVPMKNNELLIRRGRNQLFFYNVKHGDRTWIDTDAVGPSLSNVHVVEHFETLVPCKPRWAAVRWPEIMEMLDNTYFGSEFRVQRQFEA